MTRYTVRPFTELKSTLDKNSYEVMLHKYMNDLLTKRKVDSRMDQFNGGGGGGKNGTKAGKSFLKPGESISSPGGKLMHKGYTLSIKDGGSVVIESALGTVLWDSLSSDWGCTDSTDSRCRTFAPPYTLKYEKSGDLTVKDSQGKMLWRAVTDTNTCGKMPGKVKFEDGLLWIVDNSGNSKLWTSGTKEDGMGKKAKRAKRELFGTGVNMCIKKTNCFTVYNSYNRDEKQQKLQLSPGKWSPTKPSAANNMNSGGAGSWGGYAYSLTIAKERCWGTGYNGHEFTGAYYCQQLR